MNKREVFVIRRIDTKEYFCGYPGKDLPPSLAVDLLDAMRFESREMAEECAQGVAFSIEPAHFTPVAIVRFEFSIEELQESLLPRKIQRISP